MVFFESSDKYEDQAHTIKKTIAIGFVTEFRGKTVVMSKLDTFIYDYPPVLRTIDGEVIPFTSASIAEDRRNLIFFEISTDFPRDKIKILPLETDISGTINIDEKVLIYSRKCNSKTIKRQKGKIIGVGTSSIDIYASTKYDLDGGPVIYYDTGKCIACIAGRKNGEKKEFTTTRFDTIKKLVTIKPEWVVEDIAVINEKRGALAKIKSTIDDYKKFYKSTHDKVVNGYGTTNVKLIDSRRKSAITAIKQYLKIIAKPVDFHFPVYQKTVPRIMEEAKTVLNDLRLSTSEEIKEEKAKQRDKKFKSDALIKPDV